MSTDSPLTVGQLKEHLRGLPDDMPIIASYDCGCAYGDVVGFSVDRATTAPRGEPEPALILRVD